MKTVKSTPQKEFIFLTFLLVVSLFLINGCAREEAVKINLSKTKEGVIQFPEEKDKIVYFGFDLRLSPETDAKIYGPSLKVTI